MQVLVQAQVQTYGCDGEAVEAVSEGFPQLDVVPPLAWRGNGYKL